MTAVNYCSIENQLKVLRTKELNAARVEDYMKAAEYRDKQIILKRIKESIH